MSKKNEAKELWPGAGLWLDLKKKLTSADWDKIEEHIDGIASTEGKILWLNRFLILFDEATARRIDAAFNANPGMWELRAQAITKDAEVFKTSVHAKLAVLKAWRETEQGEELDTRYRAEQRIEELEAKSQAAEVAESEDSREQENIMPDGGIDYSDLESIKRELESYESLERKLSFLAQTGMKIKKEFAAAEKEWVAAGQSFESPLRANVDRWGLAVGKILPWIVKNHEKYRCWIRLQTGKEHWPDAGIDLDLKNIRDDDGENCFELVEERLKSLPDHKAKIEFLKHFVILLRHESGMGMEENDYGSASKGARHLYGRCASAVRMFKQWTELKATDDQPTDDPEEKNEDDPVPGTWTNQQAAVAIYALLREAGMPSGVADRAAGRFAWLLTGRSPNTMRHAHHNAVYGSFSDEDARIVADAFTKIGLGEVASEVRKKFQEEN